MTGLSLVADVGIPKKAMTLEKPTMKVKLI